MITPPLPDSIVIIAVVIIPVVAIIMIVLGMYRSSQYWKDSVSIARVVRRGLAGFQEQGTEGLFKFDRQLDQLNSLVPDLLSATAQVLSLCIYDAKGVVLNELSPEKVKEPERLKARLSKELTALTEAIASKDVTSAFGQIGRIYLAATLQSKELPERGDFGSLDDEQILRILIDFSDALFQGEDRALLEELGSFLETRSRSGWATAWPLAVLAVYWLRQELFEISSEQWFPFPEPRRSGVLGLWANREELLGLSMSDVALSIAEGDGEALIRAIVCHHKRQRYPITLARVRHKLLLKRTNRLLVASD